METIFSAIDLDLWTQEGWGWIDRNVLNWWNLGQGVAMVLFWLAASLAGRMVHPPLQRALARPGLSSGLRVLLTNLEALRRPILFLLPLWLLHAVMREVTWPSHSYLLGVVASLVTAWIVIHVASRLISNAILARTLAIVAWSVAALNITNLLQPTLSLMEAAAVDLGGMHISLLTIAKGMIALFVLLWIALSLSRLLEQRLRQISDLTPSVQVLLGKILKITLIAIALLAALNTVGIDLTAFAVFSGAIGLGVGFGLQKVVSNLISGIILLLDKSIKPGDVISLGETFGWITSLGARYVSVVTRDGREHLIPNEDLITQQVINWSFSDKRVRLEIPFGVSYRCDPHEVRRLAREAAGGASRVADDPAPVCHLVGFGDSSLDFVLRFWINDPSGGVVNIKGEVLLALWDAFNAAGVEIPYPHREVILQSPVKLAPAAPDDTTIPAASPGTV